jgi:NAD(P)-dependent dehydrogenase (short-subunit alcohol dehydrogenase family)
MLKDKIIIVTGGSGLLGKAIITNLNKHHATVINADINAANQLEDGTFFCDVASKASITELLDAVVAKYGRIDGFINNAYPRTNDWGNKFENIDVESWRKNVDMQMNSVFMCCQAVLKVMHQQKSGSIVNISSIYGSVGPDFGVYNGTEMTMPAAYSAIKGGIVNFTRYLAAYSGPFGVRVNCVSPGGIFDNQNQIFVTQYEQKVPMRRMGLPEDIAPSVSFLLSDNAAYITGHNLMVDGGWTAI